MQYIYVYQRYLHTTRKLEWSNGKQFHHICVRMCMHMHKSTHTVGTHEQPYRHMQQTHNISLLLHTSSSSFTLHLPPSRRDWTSCSLPSAAATSRSLTTEALDAACVMTDVAFKYTYIAWDRMVCSNLLYVL